MKHGGGSANAWALMAANGTVSLALMDDVTANKSSRVNSEVYRTVLSAQIQPNASKLSSSQCRWTMTRSEMPQEKAGPEDSCSKGLTEPGNKVSI